MNATGPNAAGRGGIRAGAAVRGLGARGALAVVVAMTVLAGCGSDEGARPLTADAFVRRPRDVGDNLPGSPVDQPGTLVDSGVRPPAPPLPPAPPTPADQETVRGINPAVRSVVRSPAVEATRPSNLRAAEAAAPPRTGTQATQPAVAVVGPVAPAAPSTPTTRPSTRPGSPGTYVDLGAVLLKVNDRAIFTDKVLGAIEPALAVEAKKRNEPSFREFAKVLIDNQIRLYVRDELEYATAERTLDAQDKALARALTIQWRQSKITEAGGSLELARRKAHDELGVDFEEMVEQRNRHHLIQVYYQKRVFPLIQVAAADIRDYYNAHKDTEFTTHGSARFRVIKIDPRNYVGMRTEAFAKAEQVQKKAAADPAAFASLASDKTVNDDPRLAANGGEVIKGGWVDQGAYAVTAVDKAVFQMHAGQVSDIIQADTGFYIVKAEEIKSGGVQPFEDLQIQERIKEKLQAEQLSALREAHVKELEKNAIAQPNEDAIRNALSIVMRRYSQWASAT
jgi:hypothetical protein